LHGRVEHVHGQSVVRRWKRATADLSDVKPLSPLGVPRTPGKIRKQKYGIILENNNKNKRIIIYTIKYI